MRFLKNFLLWTFIGAIFGMVLGEGLLVLDMIDVEQVDRIGSVCTGLGVLTGLYAAGRLMVLLWMIGGFALIGLLPVPDAFIFTGGYLGIGAYILHGFSRKAKIATSTLNRFEKAELTAVQVRKVKKLASWYRPEILAARRMAYLSPAQQSARSAAKESATAVGKTGEEIQIAVDSAAILRDDQKSWLAKSRQLSDRLNAAVVALLTPEQCQKQGVEFAGTDENAGLDGSTQELSKITKGNLGQEQAIPRRFLDFTGQSVGKLVLAMFVLLLVCTVPRTKREHDWDGLPRGDDNSGQLNDSNFVATGEDEPDLVDSGYCFRLQSPGKNWNLLKAEEIQGIVPDAVAGAVRAPGGTWAAVIVEPVGNAELKDFIEMIRLTSTGEHEQLGEVRLVDFQGRSAAEFDLFLEQDGLSMQIRKLLFIHQKFGYQIVVAASREKFNPLYVDQFRGMFSLTEGTVRPRPSRKVVKQFRDIGQRVVDGRFESAVGQLVVTPTNEWELVVGDELEEMDEEAEIGFKNIPAGLYLTVTVESVLDEYRTAYRQDMITRFRESYEGLEEKKSVWLKVSGEEIEFIQFVVQSGLSSRFLSGVYFYDGRAYTMTGWWVDGQPGDPQEALATGLNQIQFLSEAQTVKLTQEMLSQVDPEHKIGPEWSLRNGVYRDFEFGMIWKKPRGFWQLTTGTAAQEFDEDARIIALEKRLGLYMQVDITPVAESTLYQHHRTAMQTFFENQVSVKQTEIAGQPALASNEAFGEGQWKRLLITTIRNGHAFQVWFWGPSETMANSESEVVDALTGFAFPGPKLKASDQTNNSFVDHRVGFQLALPKSDWQVSEGDFRNIRSVGNDVWFQQGKRGVRVYGLTIEGRDPDSVMRIMNEALKGSFSLLTESEPSISHPQFAGISWTQQNFSDGSLVRGLLTGALGNSAFGIFVQNPRGGTDMLQQVKLGFKLSDELPVGTAFFNPGSLFTKAGTKAGIYNKEGLSLYQKGKFYNAIVAFSKAIEEQFDYAEAYYNRGKARLANGDQAEAKADFAKSDELQGLASSPILVRYKTGGSGMVQVFGVVGQSVKLRNPETGNSRTIPLERFDEDSRIRIIAELAKRLSPTLSGVSEEQTIAVLKELGAEIEGIEDGSELEVDLDGSQISDTGLVHVKSLTNLWSLSLGNTQITNRGLVHLKGLTKVEWLDLTNTQITDWGVVHLKELAELRGFNLDGTQISDAGLVFLGELKNLKFLSCSNTQISNLGLASLRGQKNLQILGLSDTKITDAGLVHLTGLKGLKQLYVTGTQISDAGLIQLKRLTTLEKLYLTGTKITDAGLAELKKALPNCKIER